MGQPAQQQDVPGIQSKMTPVPDCGEDSYQGTGQLEGKVAVITGADSGIGRAVAIAYAREGADVLISYLSEDSDAEEVKSYVEKAGRKACLVKGDISQPHHCRDLIATAVKELGGVDILVSNAAYQMTYESLEEIPDEDWDRTFDTKRWCVLPPGEGGRASYEGRIVDHRQLVGELRYALADPRAVCRHQGRDRQLLCQPGAVAGREGHPREQRRARTDLDAPDPGHHAARESREVRSGHAPGPSGPTGRACSGVCPARLGRWQLHLRSAGGRDRGSPDPLIPVLMMGRLKAGTLTSHEQVALNIDRR